MSTQPWRGTLIFAGTLAAIAATAAARFSGSGALSGATAVQNTGSSTTSGQSGAASGSTGTSAASGTSGASSATGTSSGTTTGTKTVVGTTEQTPYGPVQVSVTFTNGKIATVKALQTPNRHGYSVQVNAYAVPILTQEAVAANSANIDTVSGATFTSQAYAQSLQSAIDKRG